MNIVKLKATASGSRPPIQSWVGEAPEGYALIAPDVDASAMQTHMGFVDLTVENGVVTKITGNEKKYQDYLKSLPEPEPAPMDETTKMKLAIAELAAVVEAQKNSEVKDNG